MNVYQYGTSDPTPPPPTPAPISATTPAPLTSGVTDLGCYTDNPSDRIMTLDLAFSKMTTEVTVLWRATFGVVVGCHQSERALLLPTACLEFIGQSLCGVGWVLPWVWMQERCSNAICL